MHTKIIYEQPLNERIRTFLRLDFLFNQAHAHIESGSLWDCRAAIIGLLDVVAILGRSDLKKELIKELEREASVLEALEKNPSVDHSKLNVILDEMYSLLDRLHAMEGQIGQHLRKNEFLTSIAQRNSIPGGSCDFDLPQYHFWLQQPLERRMTDLKEWFDTFDAVNRSVRLLLKLIRSSSPSKRELAQGGFYQQSLDPTTPCQLIRVVIASESRYYAEVSGGKHRFTVRFVEQNLNDKNAQTKDDVEFDLICCII